MGFTEESTEAAKAPIGNTDVTDVAQFFLTLTDNFEKVDFTKACLWIAAGALNSDRRKAFVAYWKERGLDSVEVDYTSLVGVPKAIDIFLAVVDFNDYQEKLWKSLKRDEYFAILERYCLSGRVPIKSMWSNKAPPGRELRSMERAYSDMKTDKIRGFVAGGHLLRILTNQAPEEGDIDFYVTDISLPDAEFPCSSVFATPKKDTRDEWVCVGSCISHVSMRHQYIGLPDGADPKEVVRNFDMTHLEMYFVGCELWRSDMCLLSHRLRKTFSRRPYVSITRMQKAEKMGFPVAPGTHILNGTELIKITQSGKWKDVKGREWYPHTIVYQPENGKYLHHAKTSTVIRRLFLHEVGEYFSINFDFSADDLVKATNAHAMRIFKIGKEMHMASHLDMMHGTAIPSTVTFTKGMNTNLGWSVINKILDTGGYIVGYVLHDPTSGKIFSLYVEVVAPTIPLNEFIKTDQLELP